MGQEVLQDGKELVLFRPQLRDELDFVPVPATESKSKTPGFGDLPLIGWLFRSNDDSFSKTNLLFFIRPKIIRTQEDLIAVTTRANNRFKAASSRKNNTKKLLDELENPVILEQTIEENSNTNSSNATVAP